MKQRKARNDAIFWFIMLMGQALQICFTPFSFWWQWVIFGAMTSLYAFLTGMYLGRYENARKAGA